MKFQILANSDISRPETFENYVLKKERKFPDFLINVLDI
jgi:hypothetical protein